MKQHMEPTPAIYAESLRSMLNNSSMWDRNDPDASLTDLLADTMHLIRVERCSGFKHLYERARKHYLTEIREHRKAQKGKAV